MIQLSNEDIDFIFVHFFMSIKNFFTETATQKRLADIAGTDKEQFTAVDDSFMCHVQEADGDWSFILDGGVKKVLNMWCDDSVDLVVGDRVTIDSVEYQVYSVKTNRVIRNRNMSGNKHKECIIYQPLS